MANKVLVIGDTHARPEQENSRFEALGNFIVEKKPDVVVHIGDFADMASLCVYDKGTLHSEGRRYVDDIASAYDAMEKMMLPIIKSKKKKPQFHITTGNHEARISRAAVQSPELYGKLSLDDLPFKSYKWNVIPFLQPLFIDGICFQHYFTSGIMGKPIGGVNHARTLVARNYQSCVAGHSHARDMWEDVRADGSRVLGLVVGCYDEGIHAYTTEQRRWWSGLVMLNEVSNGYGEPSFYSIDYVKRNFL